MLLVKKASESARLSESADTKPILVIFKIAPAVIPNGI